MRRLVYITYIDYSKNSFSGVKHKIQGQIKAFTKVGYDVDLVTQYDDRAIVYYNRKEKERYYSYSHLKRFSILKAVKDLLKKNEYEVAYIRFQFFSEDVFQILKELKQNKTKILVEIPTYPYEQELHNQGIKGEIKLLCDKLYRKRCVNLINTFVSPCPVKSIYGRQSIKICNGYDYSKEAVLNNTLHRDSISLLAVASMFPSHGYDRVIKGIANYYAQGGKRKIVFHIVGDGPCLKEYKELVSTFKLEFQVIFHGNQTGENLRAIVSKCNIAIGALASFRANIYYLSTLKSREYSAWGLPSINCTKTDIIDENDPLHLYIEENENPVNISEIINFFERIYYRSGMPINVIANRIRRQAMFKSSIDTAYNPILEYLKKE